MLSAGQGYASRRHGKENIGDCKIGIIGTCGSKACVRNFAQARAADGCACYVIKEKLRGLGKYETEPLSFRDPMATLLSAAYRYGRAFYIKEESLLLCNTKVDSVQNGMRTCSLLDIFAYCGGSGSDVLCILRRWLAGWSLSHGKPTKRTNRFKG